MAEDIGRQFAEAGRAIGGAISVGSEAELETEQQAYALREKQREQEMPTKLLQDLGRQILKEPDPAKKKILMQKFNAAGKVVRDIQAFKSAAEKTYGKFTDKGGLAEAIDWKEVKIPLPSQEDLGLEEKPTSKFSWGGVWDVVSSLGDEPMDPQFETKLKTWETKKETALREYAQKFIPEIDEAGLELYVRRYKSIMEELEEDEDYKVPESVKILMGTGYREIDGKIRKGIVKRDKPSKDKERGLYDVSTEKKIKQFMKTNKIKSRGRAIKELKKEGIIKG